jgi:hypothetical protein
MQWGYSGISLAIWALLPIYVSILCFVFLTMSRGKNRHRIYSVGAIILVIFHGAAILSLATNDSAATVKSVGFEAWVCGRQIQPAQSSALGRVFRDGNSFLENERVFVNSSEESVGVANILDGTGVSFSEEKVSLELSKEFELKLSSDSSLEWLRGSLSYEGGSSAKPVLSVANSELKCPSLDGGEWNAFVASVDNVKNEYSWKKVSVSELAELKLKAKDGNDLPDCLILDYGANKTSPEYRCGYLLKNDSKRCPSENKNSCKFKEILNGGSVL